MVIVKNNMTDKETNLLYKKLGEFTHRELQLRGEIGRKAMTIRKLVALVDELRQPYNNGKRHDLYLKATDMLNEFQDEGWIE
jgi:hypothetical protein